MSKQKGKKKRVTQKREYSPQEYLEMIEDTSNLVAQENATRLSAVGPAANESGTLTNTVEFWKWMDRNYSKSGHFANAQNLQEYVNSSDGHEKWARLVTQGKGYEWDWMAEQRKSFSNLFKTYNAGDVANRPGSDVTVRNWLNGAEDELQLKAYTSKNKPELKNTPKTMTVVTNTEKVSTVSEMGYDSVIEYGDNDSIKAATDKRMNAAKTGKAQTSYTIQNVGKISANAGVMGFVIGATAETLTSYKRYKGGKITKEEYLREVLKSGCNAGMISSFSAAIMVPVSAYFTVAGVSTLVTIPISYVVSASVNKVIAPMFGKGDYLKILTDAVYYQRLVDYCDNLVLSMTQSMDQYESFVGCISNQTQAFYNMRGQVLDSRAVEDFEYLASQPREKAGMILSGMVALINDTDTMAEELQNQPFYQRMIRTIFGKNRVTKEEIRKNYEKLTVYVAEAISVLYDRQNVDERIIQILSNQILELCSDDIVLAQKIQAIDEKIDSVKDALTLILEIDHGYYKKKSRLVAICEIIMQLDYRTIHDSRMMRLLCVSMNDQQIISPYPMTVNEFVNELDQLSDADAGVIYASLIKYRHNLYARAVLQYIEKTRFYLISTGQVESALAPVYGLFENTTLNWLFDSLLESKKKMGITNGYDTVDTGKDEFIETGDSYQNAETLFYDGKLIDAYQYFLDSANENNPRAYYYLCEYFQHGYGHIRVDEEKAAEFARKGMELGDSLCTLIYGDYKYHCSDLSVDWRNKHLSPILRLKRMKDPVAIYEYGLNLTRTPNISGSTAEEAIKCFQESAKLGYWPGAFTYFKMTEDIRREFNEDLPDYSSLFENVEWYESYSVMGYYYTVVDKGSRRYYRIAADKYRKSLWLQDQDNPAAGLMAFLLNTGFVENSIKDGISVESMPMYYKEGLRCGNPLALLQLGVLYMSGIGEDEKGSDWKKAYEHLKASYSLKPMPYPALLLGIILLSGEGVEENDELAFEYLNYSAQNGEKLAYGPLADCYEYGWGVKSNLTKSKELRSQSVDPETTPINMMNIIMEYFNSYNAESGR